MSKGAPRTSRQRTTENGLAVRGRRKKPLACGMTTDFGVAPTLIGCLSSSEQVSVSYSYRSDHPDPPEVESAARPCWRSVRLRTSRQRTMGKNLACWMTTDFGGAPSLLCCISSSEKVSVSYSYRSDPPDVYLLDVRPSPFRTDPWPCTRICCASGGRNVPGRCRRWPGPVRRRNCRKIAAKLDIGKATPGSNTKQGPGTHIHRVWRRRSLPVPVPFDPTPSVVPAAPCAATLSVVPSHPHTCDRTTARTVRDGAAATVDGHESGGPVDRANMGRDRGTPPECAVPSRLHSSWRRRYTSVGGGGETVHHI